MFFRIWVCTSAVAAFGAVVISGVRVSRRVASSAGRILGFGIAWRALESFISVFIDFCVERVGSFCVAVVGMFCIALWVCGCFVHAFRVYTPLAVAVRVCGLVAVTFCIFEGLRIAVAIRIHVFERKRFFIDTLVQVETKECLKMLALYRESLSLLSVVGGVDLWNVDL